MVDNDVVWGEDGSKYDHDKHYDDLCRRVGELIAERGVRHAVFLGAGASAALGMPTTCDFFEEAFGMPAGEFFGGHRQLESWQDFVAWLGRCAYPSGAPTAVDLEVVWSQLDSLLEVLRPVDDYRARLASLYALLHVARQRKTAQDWAKFSEHQKAGDDAVRFLQRTARAARTQLTRLLQTVYGCPDRQDVMSQWVPFRRLLGLGENGSVGLFTTNYDLVAEAVVHALTGSYEVLADGFRPTANGYVWAPERFLHLSDDRILLHKLHGSVNWYTFDGEMRRRGHDEATGALEGGSMTFMPPVIGGKSNGAYWCTLLYDLLRAWTQHVETWFVIGFSFRDDELRNVFMNALESGSISKCVVIAPKVADGCDVNQGLRTIVTQFTAEQRSAGGRSGEVCHLDGYFKPEIAEEALSHMP